MCGISGIVTKESRRYEPEIKKMIGSLSHRGPDANGTYFFDDCALGHNRLSIVDISSGDQPMLGQNKAITFNGEIYGYEKIRKELSSHYNFKTKSDTEVILALYEKHGDDFIKYLPGMFSFAIWDEKEKKLIAGRDRFGEKPFYYAFGQKGELIFASEIKAIISTGLIIPEIDIDSVAHYLKRLYVAPDKTIYKNIFTIPPAHLLTHINGETTLNRYWSLPSSKANISPEEASEGLKMLLDESINEQLVADVPVGTFLSGGLDSSTIVALASKYKNGIKTFSFNFGDSRNETGFAKEIAIKYKTDHTELFPDKHDLGELLLKMSRIYDEPFADSSNIPTYLLSEAARKHVKVVLTGDGGDELFGGYANWYRPLFEMMQEKDNSKIKTALLYFAAKVAFEVNLKNRKKIQNRYLASRFKNKYESIAHAHNSQNTTFNDETIKQLLNAGSFHNPDYIPDWTETNTIDDALRMDVSDYMPGDILVKIDRASMANGLELRSPFLSKDFAEYAISLPWKLKINSEEDKVIFRRAFSDLWTQNIKKRNKQGFGSPISDFLKDSSIYKIKNEILSNRNSKIFNLISFDTCSKFIQKDSQKTWTLLVLALWMENHHF